MQNAPARVRVTKKASTSLSKLRSVTITGRRLDSFSPIFEVMNQLFHVLEHFFLRRRRYLAVVGDIIA